jgi:hypothetical protein
LWNNSTKEGEAMNFNLERFIDQHIKSVYEDDFFEFIDIPVLRPFKRKASQPKEGEHGKVKVNPAAGYQTAQVRQVYN